MYIAQGIADNSERKSNEGVGVGSDACAKKWVVIGVGEKTRDSRLRRMERSKWKLVRLCGRRIYQDGTEEVNDAKKKGRDKDLNKGGWPRE